MNKWSLCEYSMKVNAVSVLSTIRMYMDTKKKICSERKCSRENWTRKSWGSHPNEKRKTKWEFIHSLSVPWLSSSFQVVLFNTKNMFSVFLSLLANLTKRREILSSDYKTSFSIIWGTQLQNAGLAPWTPQNGRCFLVMIYSIWSLVIVVCIVYSQQPV